MCVSVYAIVRTFAHRGHNKSHVLETELQEIATLPELRLRCVLYKSSMDSQFLSHLCRAIELLLSSIKM